MRDEAAAYADVNDDYKVWGFIKRFIRWLSEQWDEDELPSETTIYRFLKGFPETLAIKNEKFP